MDNPHRPNIPHDEWMDLQRYQDDPVNKNRIDVLVMAVSVVLTLALIVWYVATLLDDTTIKPRACGGFSPHDCVAMLGGAG